MSRLRALCRDGVVLTDGAWATELQQRGLALGESADLWNLTHPDAVEAVARSYVDAGSRVILTNTFRANGVALEALGAAGNGDAINRRGVALSRAAAVGQVLVFGAMGPIGTPVSPDVATRAFRRQAEILAEAGADALVLETFGALDEARVALRAARATGLPVVASFSFFLGPAHDLTSHHATPEQTALVALDEGADALGANCGCGPADFAAICRRLSASAPNLPLWIKPNAGLPTIVGKSARYLITSDAFADYVFACATAGASFVGGCCGAGPTFIRQLGVKLAAGRNSTSDETS